MPSTPPSVPVHSTTTPLGEKGVDGISTEKEREKVLYPGRVMLTSEFPTSLFLRLSFARRGLFGSPVHYVLGEALELA